MNLGDGPWAPVGAWAAKIADGGYQLMLAGRGARWAVRFPAGRDCQGRDVRGCGTGQTLSITTCFMSEEADFLSSDTTCARPVHAISINATVEPTSPRTALRRIEPMNCRGNVSIC